MPHPLLHVDHITKAYTDGQSSIRALRDISFSVDRGELVCLLGPSGSGKSTLLRIVAGLLPADSGTVWFDGQQLHEPHPAIGFVFQKSNLMPWRTVMQNVLLPLELARGTPTAADHQHAEELLTLVGLEGFAHAYPRQLSGGMSQRVVLARTLIHQPQLLLMDEPFGALDALTRERLNVELLRIQQLRASTILMVTHSMNEAVFLADRVLVLSDRPGRIQAEIAIDLPRPRPLSVMSSARFGHLTMQVRQRLGMEDEVMVGTDSSYVDK